MGAVPPDGYGLGAAGLLVMVVGCAAPAYNYNADSADHAYFKVPASWQPVNSQVLAVAQGSELANSAARPAGGSFAWSRAYAAQWNASADTLLTASSEPVVYASVQALGSQFLPSPAVLAASAAATGAQQPAAAARTPRPPAS